MTSQAMTAHTKWEYLSLTRVSEAALVESLNQIGQDGWELVNAAQYRDVQGMLSWTAILKRPAGGEAARTVTHETASAPLAASPPPKPTQAPKAAGPAEEDTEFEINTPAPRPPRRPAPPRSPRPAPAKPRMELSDDFDFELAETTPAAQLATKQTKVKPKQTPPAEDFDFELGDTFPVKLQAAKPAPPAAKLESVDETDFDLG